jgi:hypothetical protein
MNISSSVVVTIGRKVMKVHEFLGHVLGLAARPSLLLTQTLRAKGVITSEEADAIHSDYIRHISDLTAVPAEELK